MYASNNRYLVSWLAGALCLTGAIDGPARAAESLVGVCPDPLVIQTDWFATPERGMAYQLAGPDGEIDTGRGAYIGPLADTGIRVEVRLGGPYTGFAPFTSVMYQDRSIFFGFVPTDQAVQNFARQPTISVLASLDINPQVLMFDPATYDFQTIADIGKSDATVLYFEGLPFMDFLIGRNILRADQVDASFDGSPARFVAARGRLVIQGYASNEPYRYEHDIKEWGKPIKSLLINDAGYEIYPQNFAVRPETLEQYHECLKRVVPMVQQAIVDYVNNPEPINQTLIGITDTLKLPVRQTSEGNAFAVKTMRELGIISNGSNATVGDLDMTRIQRVIDEQLRPIFEKRGHSVAAGLKAKDIQTNEYIDPEIGL